MSPKLDNNTFTRAHLFPLPNLILNPGGKITLNLFEPRYLKLLDDCLENNIPMAIGHALPESRESFVEIPHEKFPFVFQEVGFGKVSVLAETEAKTKIIVVEGQGKGKISSIFPRDNSFISVDLEPCPFNGELEMDSLFLYRRLRDLTKEKVRPLVASDREVQVIMDNLKTPSQLVAFYTDHMLQDFETRLKIFLVNDVNEKIKILLNYLVTVH